MAGGGRKLLPRDGRDDDGVGIEKSGLISLGRPAGVVVLREKEKELAGCADSIRGTLEDGAVGWMALAVAC